MMKLTNKELVEKYPFLVIRTDWYTGKPLSEEEINYEHTWWDDIPEGWAKAFGVQMCDELLEILKKGNCLNDYRIVQIKEKFGCYDEETEVLTKDGWKYFKDIKLEDEIATLDTDGETLVYTNPTDIISYHYKGDMYSLKNRGVDLCVTPNHNLYVSKGSYYYHKKNNEKHTYPYELVTPDKYFGKDKRFKKGALWQGIEPAEKFKIQGYSYTNYMKINDCMRTYKKEDLEFDIIPFLKFLGFYIAEGHSDHGDGVGSEIRVAYNEYNEEELVTKLISDIGYTPKQAGRGLKRFSDVSLAVWLKENCGHLAPNKKVPDFIKELPPKYIEIFLEYLFIGDGHQAKTSNILTTTSKQLSDDVQELLIKCGYAFREMVRKVESGTKNKNRIKSPNKLNIISKHDLYEINWLKLTEIEIDNSKAKNTLSFEEKWIDYDGMVYCVTVPNHVVYVRRNGKGVWCGNSLRWYDNGIPLEIRDKYYTWLKKYEDLSFETCIICGEPATHETRGWINYVCEDCYNKIENRKRKFNKNLIDN